MTAEEFDQYRDAYPKMPAHELSEWHSRLYREYPDQSHFNGGALLMFFSGIAADDVIEIGGWDGAAARIVLMANPEIKLWKNYEVCREAVEDTICTSERYHAKAEAAYEAVGADTLVLSHVIEHMSDGQAMALLSGTDADHLYIDAPLGDRQSKWGGTTCFHLLEFGWNDLDRFVRDQKFKLKGTRGAETKWYTR